MRAGFYFLRVLYCLIGLIASPVFAQSPQIKVVAFAGASNWPFWVGQQKGFFEQNKIEAQLDITPNSIEMAKNLHQGRYDLALTSVDNIIAYDEGQGEAQLDGAVNFVALFGVDNGLLNVMAQPEITSFADLKGKTVSVDAMTTGFAFVLRDLLEKNQIGLHDVQWIKVGGGAQRLEALNKKEQALTLLNTPLDLLAEARGMRRLVNVQTSYGAYQGIVGASTRKTAQDKSDLLASFIKAFHQSVGWLADPSNKEEALSILQAKIPSMTRSTAEKAYQILLDPQQGLYRDLRINRLGMQTVLALRSRYGEPKKTLLDPERYIDENLLNRVLQK